jgi:hypothetical protein
MNGVQAPAETTSRSALATVPDAVLMPVALPSHSLALLLELTCVSYRISTTGWLASNVTPALRIASCELWLAVNDAVGCQQSIIGTDHRQPTTTLAILSCDLAQNRHCCTALGISAFWIEIAVSCDDINV